METSAYVSTTAAVWHPQERDISVSPYTRSVADARDPNLRLTYWHMYLAGNVSIITGDRKDQLEADLAAMHKLVDCALTLAQILSDAIALRDSEAPGA